MFVWLTIFNNIQYGCTLLVNIIVNHLDLVDVRVALIGLVEVLNVEMRQRTCSFSLRRVAS